MGGLNDWKRKVPQAASPENTRRDHAIRSQIAAAAGAEYFQNRDPVYHVTENFQKTFDLMGSQRARQYAGERNEGIAANAPGLSKTVIGGQREGPSETDRDDLRELYRQSDMDRMVAPAGDPGSRMFLNRFSEVAFQRGMLSGAILRGTGKMMLFSCLKRTVGQSQPRNIRQRMLFEGASVRRNVAGRSPDQVIFNRGAVDGAVGLVVDVLRDARRTVDTLGELATGKNMLPAGSGAETLLKMYPFLSDTEEHALLEEYRSRLHAEQDVNAKALLQHAIVKTQALIKKKQEMKQRFIVALRSISDNASSALATFSQPGFVEEMYSLLEKEPEPEPPPDDGDDDSQDTTDGQPQQ